MLAQKVKPIVVSMGDSLTNVSYYAYVCAYGTYHHNYLTYMRDTSTPYMEDILHRVHSNQRAIVSYCILSCCGPRQD